MLAAFSVWIFSDSSYRKLLWFLHFFSAPQTFLNDMQIRCVSVKRRKKPPNKRNLGSLVGWWRCEAQEWSWQTGNNARQLPWQRTTWKVESLDDGPLGRNSLFYFIFTRTWRNILLSLIGVVAAGVVRKPETWRQWCKWQGLHFDGHVKNVFSSPFMRYYTKIISIINMQVGTQLLFLDSTLPCLYVFTILGHFVAPQGFVQDTYTFHTKQRRCTGSGSDPLPTSIWLPRAGRHADRRTI